MKLNYKRLILWILFIITFINLFSANRIYYFLNYIEYYQKDSKNSVLLFFIKELHYSLGEGDLYSLIYGFPPYFFGSLILFILFPLFRIIPKNLLIPFIIIWLIINYTIIILLYKKLNLLKKTFIKIILYPIILNYLFLCGFDFIPYQFDILGEIAYIIYPIYLFCDWLYKIIEKHSIKV